MIQQLVYLKKYIKASKRYNYSAAVKHVYMRMGNCDCEKHPN